MFDYLPKKSTFTPAIKPFSFTQKAKPTSQPILQPLIDKARAEVAARQPAAAAAKAAPKAAIAYQIVGDQVYKYTAKKKGGEDEDFGPIMQVSDKQRRVNEERALKTLKWNFDVPRKEFVEQLRNQIEAANWNKTLIGMIRQWA